MFVEMWQKIKIVDILISFIGQIIFIKLIYTVNNFGNSVRDKSEQNELTFPSLQIAANKGEKASFKYKSFSIFLVVE